MSEMIERVARAMAGKRWQEFDEEHRNAGRDLARKAMQAMREVQDEISQSGGAIFHREASAYDAERDRQIAGVYAVFVWRAMIDEALK